MIIWTRWESTQGWQQEYLGQLRKLRRPAQTQVETDGKALKCREESTSGGSCSEGG